MIEQYRIDLARYRLEKAKARLHSAQILLQDGDWDDSIGRSYYAVFTAARVLLALKGLDSKKHSGVIALFNQHFIKDGKIHKNTYRALIDAKIKRESADYEDYVSFSKEEAVSQLAMAKDFVTRIEDVFNAILAEDNSPE